MCDVPPYPAPLTAEDAALINLRAYQGIATRWHRARQVLHPHEAQALACFVDGLTPPALILDLGCGTGRPLGAELLARGFSVLGVDQSPAMLAHARRNLPDGLWLCQRIEGFRPVMRPSGVVCWDTLFHLPRSEYAPLLTRLATSLAPGGRLMLSTGGPAPPPCLELLQDRPYFYDASAPEFILTLLQECGFDLCLTEHATSPDGRHRSGRLLIVARRTSTAAPLQPPLPVLP